MSYSVGETVVYPHHGAATIMEIRERKVRGEKRTYLTLHVEDGDLTIQVPAENVEMVGMRDVVDEAGVSVVFDILRSVDDDEPDNWSRRFKINEEKIASGEVNSLAEVVRDLSHRETDKKLSAGEKRMLLRARQILVGELALADDVEQDEVERLIDEALGVAQADEDSDDTEAKAVKTAG